MISIICPVYNSAEYIKNTIKSLLDQNNVDENIEIVFIDDMSTDATLKIINDNISLLNKKKYEVRILKQEHKGPGAARNYGIKEAKYKYIAFLDSDDIWYENKLSLCIKLIYENKNFNCFVHDEKFVRMNKKNSLIQNGYFKFTDISKSLYIRNSLSTSALIIEKKIIESGGFFDEKLQSSQDYDLWLKISKKLNIYKIDEVLGEYNEKTNSITAKYYLYRFTDQLTIAIRYRHYVSKLQFIKKIIKIILSKQWVIGLLGKKSHGY